MSVATTVDMYDFIYIGVPTKAQAFGLQAKYGGWVFLPEGMNEDEPVDEFGMPLSCGRPLCNPGDHHQLCLLHQTERTVIWFSHQFTQSQAFNHRILRGISGAFINCTESYL